MGQFGHLVLELLRRIQKERNVAYLLISHDLALVRKVAERVLVMYAPRRLPLIAQALR